MHITTGRFKGKKIITPEGLSTRPTANRVRQALFNILAHKISFKDMKILDIFAGSGALGLEALSRGGAQAFFVEDEPRALTCLKKNIETISQQECCKVFPTQAQNIPFAPFPCQIIFMDPPYHSELGSLLLPLLIQRKWLETNSMIVLEVGAQEKFLLPDPSFDIKEERIYGATRLIFMTYRES
jgi:16S rRNA (guanine966-N2)-methyltransferase